MLSSVEVWWAGLCALPFDGAQGDTPRLEREEINPGLAYTYGYKKGRS
jgi:hypothetical protein